MAHTGPALLLAAALVALAVFAFWVQRQGTKKAAIEPNKPSLLPPGQNHPATSRLHYDLVEFEPVTPELASVWDVYHKLTTPPAPAPVVEEKEPEESSTEVTPNDDQSLTETPAEPPVVEAAPAAAPAPLSDEERALREQSRRLMDNPYDTAAPAYEAQQQTQREQLQKQRKTLPGVVLKDGPLPTEVVPVHQLPVARPAKRRQPKLEEVED